MIERAAGNLLLAEAEALVNTVNCEGFMGKGIALQFKQAFPDNFKVYQKACKAGEVTPGSMLIVEPSELVRPKYIINFPTKRQWREKSRLEDIESGLAALIADVLRLGIKSIAVPPLGCGNGGLDWEVVRPLIEKAFEPLPDVRVLLYEPSGSPPADTMPVRTERPNMTPGRALLIKLIEQYSTLAYRKTLLEIQKLAYFLQVSGEDLRLKYVAHHYGPYAHNLGKVLERIEGHFLRGYGDSLKPDVELELLPGAVEEADAFLADKKESLDRLKRVAELIEGFETPYGMELLSSVHWVATQGSKPAKSGEEAVGAIQGWNARKKKLFKPEHVRIAWRRLEETKWLPTPAGI
jgi:O-acetyl-ADP-ribose deacetylase (regulator of RNase III)